MNRDEREACEPDAMPVVGSVLELASGQWRYDGQDQAVRIQVQRVRTELSRWYSGEWVWVEGPVSVAGGPVGWRQILVRVDAIPAGCRAGDEHPNSGAGS